MQFFSLQTMALQSVQERSLQGIKIAVLNLLHSGLKY